MFAAPRLARGVALHVGITATVDGSAVHVQGVAKRRQRRVPTCAAVSFNRDSVLSVDRLEIACQGGAQPIIAD